MPKINEIILNRAPKFLLRLIHLPPRLLYAVGLGPLIGSLVLLLITTGRKTGKPRVTPLQYELIDGKVYLGSALGQKADWLRNLQANPAVEVRLKGQRFRGTAKIITDAKQIANYLEVRLRRHPRMVGAMLKAEGITQPPQREEMEHYASKIVLVVITKEGKLG
jgi:deazaflavin-dependent oxidoreductase (nitroreductase family)